MDDVGDLHSADALSDPEVINGIVSIVHAENKFAAHKFKLLAEFSRRGLNLHLKCTNPSHWLAAGTRVARGNADRQFETANWLTSWPTVIDALTTGDIHSAHVKEIHDGYKYIRTSDPELSTDRITDAVADLLDTALTGTANRVRERAQELGHAAANDARARYERTRREQEQREKERPEQERREQEKKRQQDEHENPADDRTPGDADRQTDQDQDTLVGPPPLLVSENPALNKLDLYRQANGRTTIKGDVDTVLAEKLRTSLSEHSRPRPIDGTRDPRSASRRNADALDHILDKNLRGQSGAGTSRARVNVTVNLRDLLANAPAANAPFTGTTPDTARGSDPADSPTTPTRGTPVAGTTTAPEGNPPHTSNAAPPPGGSDPAGNTTGVSAGKPPRTGDTAAPSSSKPGPSMDDPEWPFHLDWTGPISLSLARLLACDAELQPIIIDNNGIPLAMGDTVRLATPDQRTAVKLRDRCCIKCGLPAHWCQVHHLVFWDDDGPTDLTNLVLVCGDCHRDIHNQGWTIIIGDDGHPIIIPPKSFDHEQKPIPSYHRRRKPAA